MYLGLRDQNNELFDVVGDFVTHAQRFINTDHAQVHEGHGYKIGMNGGTLTKNTTKYFSFRVTGDKYIHLKSFEGKVMGGSIQITFMRGTADNPLVIDADTGTLKTPQNLNDNFDDTTVVTIKNDPTVVSSQYGEEWQSVFMIADSTRQATGVGDFQGATDAELVMKPNTDYLIKITEMNIDDVELFILGMFYYEEGEGVS